MWVSSEQGLKVGLRGFQLQFEFFRKDLFDTAEGSWSRPDRAFETARAVEEVFDQAKPRGKEQGKEFPLVEELIGRAAEELPLGAFVAHFEFELFGARRGGGIGGAQVHVYVAFFFFFVIVVVLVVDITGRECRRSHGHEHHLKC